MLSLVTQSIVGPGNCPLIRIHYKIQGKTNQGEPLEVNIWTQLMLNFKQNQQLQKYTVKNQPVEETQEEKLFHMWLSMCNI